MSTIRRRRDGSLEAVLGPCAVSLEVPSLLVGHRRARIQAELASIELSARQDGTGAVASCAIPVGADCRVLIRDVWNCGNDDLALRRTITVKGSPGLGFAALVEVGLPCSSLSALDLFAPGLVYGAAESVAPCAIGGVPSRRMGAATVLAREDRMAAPLVAARWADGRWIGILDSAPDGATVRADVEDEFGVPLTSPRFRFASLGLVDHGTGQVSLVASLPGTEGETTYSNGGLPLTQYPGWRVRLFPAEDGFSASQSIRLRGGHAGPGASLFDAAWRWAWEVLDPSVPRETGPGPRYACAEVLASQVRSVNTAARGELTGVGLESDATTGRPVADANAALMGFVGANTQAAYVLLREAARRGPGAGSGLRDAGVRILDSFSSLPMEPPSCEGFDLATGSPSTYRLVAGRPAVFLRSLADGALAALEAAIFEEAQGTSRPAWRGWARAIGQWIVSEQRSDGSLPRAWEAGSGVVLEESGTATALAVPLLSRLASIEGPEPWGEAALGAGNHVWRRHGVNGDYAGATLDNPDVVDKEAALGALEAYLCLHRLTGDPLWARRALQAAMVAQTWVHLWDVPPPEGMSEEDLHWKSGCSTVGMQLITTGVTMSDGFAVASAAAFAELARICGDEYWMELARLVHHGSVAMLATPDRPFDLAGPGWQQEHWCFGPRRGFGLNRHWLPWTAAGVLAGQFRLDDARIAL
ncbi:MAG: hypothetical protein LBK95_16685 [Bifidobacteriaceae bacterium]|jgi:hypothetical protein|nr:hypothetical protein [Bifidobacteriaceae bacterium]